ncbi:hypothetical protein D2V17_19720 [Aurantiacibacter xanthus]|uniref:Gluconate 2-dehydrogenase subunit 3 family protein n=1 Tax=Aurantiacibacter xanthus TaxID=1784712 RepID=A0A3A1NYV6_9SPHN|nr:gluconate 2-dehydrogenase subunit 3 family protein [Aurantiacibacter xanthus]RIV80085.1 hypothetical protein D2V17_19720 [Aurantiacibacter xanthus]
MLAGAGAALSACDAIGLADEDSPFRYSAEDMALITALADRIVPKGDSVGALDAGVPAAFEGLMANWASEETRAQMAGVLAALGALGGGFAALPAGEQSRLLADYDAAALAPAPQGEEELFSPPSAKDADYQRFKQIIVLLFYVSEPALTHELAYTHMPGRWDPSIPVTPETRPEGGAGSF